MRQLSAAVAPPVPVPCAASACAHLRAATHCTAWTRLPCSAALRSSGSQSRACGRAERAPRTRCRRCRAPTAQHPFSTPPGEFPIAHTAHSKECASFSLDAMKLQCAHFRDHALRSCHAMPASSRSRTTRILLHQSCYHVQCYSFEKMSQAFSEMQSSMFESKSC